MYYNGLNHTELFYIMPGFGRAVLQKFNCMSELSVKHIKHLGLLHWHSCPGQGRPRNLIPQIWGFKRCQCSLEWFLGEFLREEPAYPVFRSDLCLGMALLLQLLCGLIILIKESLWPLQVGKHSDIVRNCGPAVVATQSLNK